MGPDLERFYDDHAQRLFAFLLNFTRNETETRDVLQDLFIRLAREPHLLQRARNPRAYLLRLAHNLAVDAIRRRAVRERREAALTEEEAVVFAPAAGPDEQAFREALARALATLPPEQRAVVHLKLWENLTFAAISETLNISSNTAASRYRYAIDKLQKQLRPVYDEIK